MCGGWGVLYGEGGESTHNTMILAGLVPAYSQALFSPTYSGLFSQDLLFSPSEIEPIQESILATFQIVSHAKRNINSQS